MLEVVTVRVAFNVPEFQLESAYLARIYMYVHLSVEWNIAGEKKKSFLFVRVSRLLKKFNRENAMPSFGVKFLKSGKKKTPRCLGVAEPSASSWHTER